MKIDKSWYLKPKNPDFPSAISAGGLVVRKTEGKILIALLKDKKFTEYMLPKGRVEEKENVDDAAKREIAEEAGLNDLNMICELGFKERLTFNRKEWRKTFYFLFTTEQEKGLQNLQEGEDDYIMEWFNLENLPAFFWPEQKEIIEENREKIGKLLCINQSNR